MPYIPLKPALHWYFVRESYRRMGTPGFRQVVTKLADLLLQRSVCNSESCKLLRVHLPISYLLLQVWYHHLYRWQYCLAPLQVLLVRPSVRLQIRIRASHPSNLSLPLTSISLPLSPQSFPFLLCATSGPLKTRQRPGGALFGVHGRAPAKVRSCMHCTLAKRIWLKLFLVLWSAWNFHRPKWRPPKIGGPVWLNTSNMPEASPADS